MDKIKLDNAVKDVKAIRGILEKTAEDFMRLGKVFIGWGLAFLVLFLCVLAAYASKTSISEIIADYPIITVIPLILAAIAASVSYFAINRMNGLHGLTKPLLAVWLVIVFYVTLLPVIRYITSLDGILKTYQGYYINNYNVFIKSTVNEFFHSYADIGALLSAFTFGLFCLRIFTRLKFTGFLSFIYLLLIVVEYIVLFESNTPTGGTFYLTFSIIGYSVIVPATFLIVGGYLEFCRLRRS